MHNRFFFLASAVVCFAAIAVAIADGEAWADTVPLDSVRVFERQPLKRYTGTIYGVAYQSAYSVGDTTFAIDRKYVTFVCEAASDDSEDVGNTGSIIVELDGEPVLTENIVAYHAPKHIEVRVSGHMRMTVRASETHHLAVINPRLITEAKESAATAPAVPMPTSGSIVPPAAQSTFVVDPNDLDKLAQALRRRVDAKPDLKQRIEQGNVAVMTFTLLDIPAQSIATNVAENLTTALINNDFPLVERGQLDKAIKELKIQDSALVDPTTAQKLGKLSGCDIILVGSISDQGQFVVINSRLMDTATGKSLAAERVEMRKIPINRGNAL